LKRCGLPLAAAAILTAGAGLVALGGDAAATALRALAVVATFGLCAAALHRWRVHAHAAAPEAVSILERHSLARETGVALVSAEGRRLLVGFGPSGVALLLDLGAPREPAP
jgi:flagellar protein FliO/FliZ